MRPLLAIFSLHPLATTLAELTQLNFDTDCIPSFPTEHWRIAKKSNWIGLPYCKEVVPEFHNRIVVEFQLNHFGWKTDTHQKIIELGTENEEAGFLSVFIPKDSYYPAIRFNSCDGNRDLQKEGNEDIFNFDSDEWIYELPMGIYTEDRPVNFRMAVILDDGITNGTRLIVTAFDDKRIDSEQQPIFYQEIKHDFFDLSKCGREISIGSSNNSGPFNGEIRDIMYETLEVEYNSPEDWDIVGRLWRPWTDEVEEALEIEDNE